MKLLRYGHAGNEKPGMLDSDGNIRDLSSVIPDVSRESLLPSSLDRIKDTPLESLSIVDPNVRIGACVGNIGKFICIGLNYSDHAAESGLEVPPEPVIFAKFTSAICGPNDNVIIPKGSEKTDWGVELGVVIGKSAKDVSKDEALDYVAGYCVVNDLSEREYQLERSGQWVKGKSCDTFGSIGPWLVTGDEVGDKVGDPQKLDIWLEVDGHRRS